MERTPAAPPRRCRRDATVDPITMKYWSRVDAVLRRRARIVAGQDADDVMQRVALQFWSDSARIMAAYTPEKFANVSLRTRADDHRRSERIQRCEGARLSIDPSTGLARPGHEVSALESIDPEAERLGTVDDHQFRAVTADELRQAMQLLEPKIAALLLLVAVGGWSVTDAAARVGLSRAYANRRLSAAKALLAEVITAA